MRHRKTLIISAIFTAMLAIAVAPDVVAQSRLVTGGSQSNFGRQALAGGFMPDPFRARITSGGNLDSSSMSLSPGCTGHVTAQPDYIVDYSDTRGFLRFYFTGQGNGDATLIINDGAGNWHCNDDSFGGRNPTVDISNPPAGQYDIWVGSYRANDNIRGQLHITEMRSRHP